MGVDLESTGLSIPNKLLLNWQTFLFLHTSYRPLPFSLSLDSVFVLRLFRGSGSPDRAEQEDGEAGDGCALPGASQECLQ